jgi:methylase of polypeptide subunit release factors
MPRISSEIIVKTALKYLEILIQKYSNQKINSGNNYRRIRIMDLGCSSGALILPVVAKLCEMIRETCKSYDDNLLDQHIKCGERTGSHTMNGWHIEAVGVDIDNESLLLALENVKLNCDKFMTDIVTCSHSDGDYNSETVITEPLKDLSESSPKSMTQSTLNFHFVCEDFSRVHRFAVIPLGIPDPSKIWDPNVRLGFDVIFSNPPYLGAAAISGRVTPEGPRCLVGGPTGTEAYQTILGAVRAGDARGPLLRPGGVLILQLPGKHDKMVGHLQKIARSEGFEVLEVLKDNRGITRCMVASLP